MDPFSLTGHLAVVSGATSGIGASITAALAAAGADIIGVSRGHRPDGHTRRTVEELGRSYRSEHADLTDRASTLSLGLRLAAGGRPVDILVNNAAIIRRAPATAHSDADWDAVLEADLSAPFLLSRVLGERMIERGEGKIIVIASMQSFQGGLELAGYTAAKTGLLGLVRALANEWAASGVNVNAIAPGYIETDMTAARRSDPDAAVQVLARIPAGRWGHPGDLAGAAVFLASAASDYVHGITLPVDGGWLAR